MVGGEVSVELVPDVFGALKFFISSVRYIIMDFFAMFDVLFLFGYVWMVVDDVDKVVVVVLSRELNEKVFGGADSVGCTLRFDNVDYRVIGVIDAWQPIP